MVVKGMNDNPFDELGLEKACAVLQDLSRHTDERNRMEGVERRSRIGKAGGVEAVIKAMQRHPSVAKLLKKACRH